MRAHRVGAERAVEADGEGPGVADRVPEGGRRLAGEGAAREVGDRAGDHHRQPRRPSRRRPPRRRRSRPWRSACRRSSRSGSGRRRRRSARGSARRRRARRSSKLTARKPGSLTSGDIEAVRLVGPSAPATKRRLAVLAPRPGRAARRASARAVAVELVDHALHAVVGLGDRGRGEGVGLDDVGAGDGVAVVDLLDRLGLGQDQEVVVALLRGGRRPAKRRGRGSRPRRSRGPGSGCPSRRRGSGCARAPRRSARSSGRRLAAGSGFRRRMAVASPWSHGRRGSGAGSATI